MNTVSIIDESLQYWEGREGRKRGKLAVEATNSRRTATGTLEVWATLRNRTDYALQIEARSHFFDKSQMEVEAPSAWRRIHLPPNSVATYRESSMTATGIDAYYIEVREGR